MTRLKIIGLITFILAVPIAALSAADRTERETCVARPPQFAETGPGPAGPGRAGPGYELISLVRGEAWATRDWTPEDYAAFSPPLSWSFWFKNDPRLGLADQARFTRSPGCDEEGRFSYMTAFGRTFVLAARPRALTLGGDERGLITGVEVEKHHVLRFAAGRTLEVLENPEGRRFIAVSAPLRRATPAPELPAGWSLAARVATEDLEVALSGAVTVIRLANGVSYQGPLPQTGRDNGLENGLENGWETGLEDSLTDG